MKVSGNYYECRIENINNLMELFDFKGFSLEKMEDRGASYHIFDKSTEKKVGNIHFRSDKGSAFITAYLGKNSKNFRDYINELSPGENGEDFDSDINYIGNTYKAPLNQASALCYQLETSGFEFGKPNVKDSDRVEIKRNGKVVAELNSRTRYDPAVFLTVIDKEDKNLVRIAEEYEVSSREESFFSNLPTDKSSFRYTLEDEPIILRPGAAKTYEEAMKSAYARSGPPIRPNGSYTVQSLFSQESDAVTEDPVEESVGKENISPRDIEELLRTVRDEVPA
ncbi:MAG: hypothetical protein ABIH52_04660 [Candidatus Aenigmatarchaeota archaeon]